MKKTIKEIKDGGTEIRFEYPNAYGAGTRVIIVTLSSDHRTVTLSTTGRVKFDAVDLAGFTEELNGVFNGLNYSTFDGAGIA